MAKTSKVYHGKNVILDTLRAKRWDTPRIIGWLQRGLQWSLESRRRKPRGFSTYISTACILKLRDGTIRLKIESEKQGAYIHLHLFGDSAPSTVLMASWSS